MPRGARDRRKPEDLQTTDRLVRSLKVQVEVIERLEQAGGEIYAIDHGRLTNGTAATRMSNNMMGAAFQ